MTTLTDTAARHPAREPGQRDLDAAALNAVAGGSGSMIRMISDRYGPHGFGLVAIVVLWFFVVQPEMRAQREENRLQRDAYVQAQDKWDQKIDVIRSAADAMNAASRAFNDGIMRLERLSDRLDRIGIPGTTPPAR